MFLILSQAGPVKACTFCSIEIDILNSREETRFRATLESISTEAKNGCEICAFLESCIQSFAASVTLRPIDTAVAADGYCILYRTADKHNNKTRYLKFEIFQAVEADYDKARLDPRMWTMSHSWKKEYSLPATTSSAETIMCIADWINDCKENHEDCARAATSNSAYPKRLLKLSGDRILLKENPTSRPGYACLSHCWGPSKDMVCTTVETIDAFKEEIHFCALSKTFQDAVDICRRLGIEYLWIDSLCIIQGSGSDLKEELGKMADIYEGAFLTLAATKSASSSEGCYSTTDPSYLAKYFPKYQVYIRRTVSPFPLDPIEFPLFQRGWIYQERRLSRRIIHFCKQEVVFQCITTSKSQSGYLDHAKVRDQLPYWKFADDQQTLWHTTICEYSMLKLSFGKDKLLGIGALAQRMEDVRGGYDRYLAGLWEKTLLEDLLWVNWNQTANRPWPWRAPTWSWASIDTPVVYPKRAHSLTNGVRVMNIHYIANGPAYTGSVVEARITIRAPLITMKLESIDFSKYNYPEKPFESVLKCVSCRGYDDKLLALAISGSVVLDYKHLTPGPCYIGPDAYVFVLPVWNVKEMDRAYDAGILLRRKPDMEWYERIGYAEFCHAHVMHHVDRRDPNKLHIAVDQQELYQRKINAFLSEFPVSDITII